MPKITSVLVSAGIILLGISPAFAVPLVSPGLWEIQKTGSILYPGETKPLLIKENLQLCVGPKTNLIQFLEPDGNPKKCKTTISHQGSRLKWNFSCNESLHKIMQTGTLTISKMTFRSSFSTKNIRTNVGHVYPTKSQIHMNGKFIAGNCGVMPKAPKPTKSPENTHPIIKPN